MTDLEVISVVTEAEPPDPPAKGPDSGGSEGLIDSLKSILGLLLSAFATVLGFIGVTSSEVTSILRNDEPAALVVFFLLVLSILAAFLSVVATKKIRSDEFLLIGLVVLVVSAYAFLIAVLPIKTVPSSSSGRVLALIFGIVIGLAGAVLFGLGVRRLVWEKPKHVANAANAVTESRAAQAQAAGEKTLADLALSDAAAAGSDDEVLRAHQKRLEHQQLQIRHELEANRHKQSALKEQHAADRSNVEVKAWLIPISGLLLGLTVLGAIRVEARNQENQSVELVATISSPTSQISELTVSVSGPRLAQNQWIEVYICGYANPSTASASGDSVGSQSGQGAKPPCAELESWTARPDQSGAVKQTFMVPVQIDAFTRIAGSAQVYREAKVTRLDPKGQAVDAGRGVFDIDLAADGFKRTETSSS